MPTFFTVLPLVHVNFAPATALEFSGGLNVTPIPTWLHGQRMLQALSEIDRGAIELSTHAFVFSYAADALGSPDPDWDGDGTRSIQETKCEVGLMANLALWLVRPSPACIAAIIHAPQFGTGAPTIQQVLTQPELLCHPHDLEARITSDSLPQAALLHRQLIEVPRDTALWTALRAAWSGLQMNIETIRYLLFWIALEALFGPEDSREITYRISQRIAFFLSTDRAEARQLFLQAKTAYGFRSKIAHGRWSEDPNATRRMAEAENLFRRAVIKILSDEDLKQTFSSRQRETFLDALVFTGQA